jgi:acetolactate synthase-1/3 small subunit
MSQTTSQTTAQTMSQTTAQTHILDLRVRNHPGVMSHITGLFSRRAFNLEAILCVPIEGGDESRMLLLVNETPKLEQIERQLAKLHDVLAVRQRPDLGADFFAKLTAMSAMSD